MRTPLLPILAFAALAGAGVPNKFTMGKSAVAQDVNDNFTYLDTNLTKKADKDSLASLKDAVNALKTGKADASVKSDLDAAKSDLKALQAKEKADSATLATSAANGLTLTAMNTNLVGLRDTLGKKKDSAWIMKAVTPAAIGAVPSGAGKVNSIPRWTGSAALDASAISDNGATINLGRPASLNGLVATTLSPKPHCGTACMVLRLESRPPRRIMPSLLARTISRRT